MKLNVHSLLRATRRYFGIAEEPAPLLETARTTQIIVASVLESGGRFLLIEEKVDGVLCLNQPAGRLEVDETVTEGAIRETLEESGVRFVPQYLVGIYDWYSQKQATRFLRLAFTGPIEDMGDGLPRDQNIVRVTWLTHGQAMTQAIRHRSPFVLACIEDHLRGVRYPLDLVRHFYPQ